MSGSSSSTELSARLAVVGAAGAEGVRVRAALADRRVAGSRVDLFGDYGGEAVIAEYADEARLIQQPDLDEIGAHDVVFLCEADGLAQRAADAARSAHVLDVAGALLDDPAATRVHLGLRGEAASGRGARLAVPHSLSLVMLDVLHPLRRSVGAEAASAVVLRPASDAGESGVDELRQQTVRLLNFESVPTETFGRQLAFNVLRQTTAAAGTVACGPRIEREVADLLDWSPGALSVELLAVPVFFGHGIALHVRGAGPIDPAAAGDALREAGLEPVALGDDAPGPIEVTGEMRTVVSEPSGDEGGGIRLWVVAGEAGDRGAEHAVRIAARAVGL